MRHIFAIIILLSSFGAGCAVIKAPSNAPDTAKFIDIELIAIVDEIQSDKMTVIKSSGERERVIFDQGISEEIQPGTLINIIGKQEESSRRIFANQILAINENNIIVTNLTNNETVTSPLIIEGFACVYENVLEWRIIDSRGDIQKQGFGLSVVKNEGFFGPFKEEIFLPTLNDVSFTLELYSRLASDGSEQNLIVMPLQLSSTEKTAFDLYFQNNLLAKTDECTELFPVQREIAKTSAVGRAAMLELIIGPSFQEYSIGYQAVIPNSVVLEMFLISEGSANLRFSDNIHELTGCRGKGIESQIKKTLMQFEGIGKVEIDGM